MKLFTLAISGLALASVLFMAPIVQVSAVSGPGPSGTSVSGPGPSASGYSVQNPLKAKSISQFVEQVLQGVLIIGIPVAVLFIVLAGLKFVTAMGDTNKITDARNNLLNTVIGIGLFLGAWTLAQVIYRTVTSLGGGPGSF